MFRFPSYYYVKLAFLIWLQLPDTQVSPKYTRLSFASILNNLIDFFFGWHSTDYFHQGARILYKKHLRPFFKRHEAKIDRIMGLTYIEMVKVYILNSDNPRINRCCLLIFGSWVGAFLLKRCHLFISMAGQNN